MATKTWPPKDPGEVLEYGFDWQGRNIGEDVIASTTAEVVAGDVIVDDHGPGTVDGCPPGKGTVTWLSGGTANVKCKILLRAITAAGRELEQTVSIAIKER